MRDGGPTRGLARLGPVALPVVLLTLLGADLRAQEPTSQTTTPSFDHSDWDHLVSTYVDEAGRVDYAGLAGQADDRARLDAYVAALASADPTQLGAPARLAFWLNAYNALVVRAVLEHWPLDSVMTVEGFFDGLRYSVAGESLTLNELEGQKLREGFHDPRIHFAANCGAASCPPLRSEAYVGERIDAQLDEQTRSFLRASTHIGDGGGTVRLSKLFEWYAGDFDEGGGVRAFAARYLEADGAAVVTRPDSEIRYDEYDWSLNSQR